MPARGPRGPTGLLQGSQATTGQGLLDRGRTVAKGLLGPAYEPLANMGGLAMEMHPGADLYAMQEWAKEGTDAWKSGDLLEALGGGGMALGSLAMMMAPGSLPLPKRRAITDQNLRDLPMGEAIPLARTEQHIIAGQNGQYVGAPRGMNNQEQLQTMRDDFDAQVEAGLKGSDWYPRAQAGTTRVTQGDPAQEHLMSGELALTSSQAAPEANLQFGLLGHNAYERGQPASVLRTGQQAETYNTARQAGEDISLGKKTGIYGGHLDPTLENPTTGTNDIWHARAFGFTNADGKEFDRALSAQEHAFLDAETLLAVDRANTKKLGGRSDWTAGEIQASPWVAGKARGLMKKYPERFPTIELAMEEASKTYPDYFDKHTAYGSSEAVPGLGTGHLPGLLEGDAAARRAYSEDPRSLWDTAAGHDLLSTETGLYSQPSLLGTGSFRSQAGPLETNPNASFRPLVDFTVDDEVGKAVTRGTARHLSALEASRAYIDAQNAGAWHKLLPASASGVKPGAANHIRIPLDAGLTEAQMKTLHPIAESYGLDLVDTGDGLSLLSLQEGPDTKAVRKILKEGKLEGELTEALGQPLDMQRSVMAGGDYIDYEDALTQPGTGEATRELLERLDDPDIPDVMKRLDDSPAVRQKALDRLERDEEWAAQLGTPIREDIQRARRIIAEEGFEGLRKALKNGAILPMAVPFFAGYVSLKNEYTGEPPIM